LGSSRSVADLCNKQNSIQIPIQLTMPQLTKVDLKDLNILKLYEHYSALERSIPMLTPESQELVLAELETCASLRSEKVDRIYYALASHEDAVERIKKEEELLVVAKKHHDAQVRQLKGLLGWLRRSLPFDCNRIQGKNYEFVLSRKKQLTVELSEDFEEWTDEEKLKYCIEEETVITKQIVLRSMSGEVIDQRTEPKQTTKILPNLDAIRDAYQNGQALPRGVKVKQDYSIRRNRLLTTKKVEAQAPEYFGEFLPESDAA
jgi:hypothetical protein